MKFSCAVLENSRTLRKIFIADSRDRKAQSDWDFCGFFILENSRSLTPFILFWRLCSKDKLLKRDFSVQIICIVQAVKVDAPFVVACISKPVCAPHDPNKLGVSLALTSKMDGFFPQLSNQFFFKLRRVLKYRLLFVQHTDVCYPPRFVRYSISYIK